MPFDIVVSAGSLRSTNPDAVWFPHPWTDTGVGVEADFTGAHLLHLAAAGCVLNDLYREAAALGLRLDGARVSGGGDFDRDTWASTGVSYAVELDADVTPVERDALLARVDEVAEIPRAIRLGATVTRSR